MATPMIITKADGTQEPFDSSKLIQSLTRAGAHPDVIQKVLAEIESSLTPGVSTKVIYRKAFSILRKLERRPAVRYSLRRAVMELGPSGFPFEKFIGEIFKEQGYTVVIGRTVQGHCIPHEDDVIAYSDTELHLVEAKFHNNHGVKTDTKVALYIKARFDDLKDAVINVGAKERTMTDGWLITNTKFTRTAKQYASCQNLHIVGWNYPQQGNLHDLIVDAELHPLTSLTTLSKGEKKLLLGQGIVLLKTIKRDPSLLDFLGISDVKKKKILDEVGVICVHTS